MSTSRQDEFASEKRTSFGLWIGWVFATVTVASLASSTTTMPPITRPAVTSPSQQIALLVTALLVAASLPLSRRLKKGRARYGFSCVLAWAGAIAIASYAFLLHFLFSMNRTASVLLGVSFLYQIILTPVRAPHARFEDDNERTSRT